MFHNMKRALIILGWSIGTCLLSYLALHVTLIVAISIYHLSKGPGSSDWLFTSSHMILFFLALLLLPLLLGLGTLGLGIMGKLPGSLKLPA
jgi:hypothetical protein